MILNGATSSVISPPFKQIRPLGSALRCSFETFFESTLPSLRRSLPLYSQQNHTYSSLLLHFDVPPQHFQSYRICHSRSHPRFLPILSISLNLQLGKRIASGIPGKPPPVPISNIFDPCLNLTTFAIPNE